MITTIDVIGRHVEKISTWNPQSSGSDTHFSYIDLSSVDKDKKIIDLAQVPRILPSDAPSRARQIVKPLDILISTVRPNLNGVAYVPNQLENATASTGYCVLRSNNLTLDPKYLYYWVQTKMFVSDMISKATGANYPAVSDKIIKESLIPLPPLAEQQKIAAILDAADSLRQKDQQLVEHYTALSQSLFLEMFGDPVTNPMGWDNLRLGETGNWRSGGTPHRKNRDYFTGNIPWITSGELNDVYISDSKEHITEDAVINSSTKILDEGSLLLGMYDTAALKSSITTKVMTCNQAIAAAKLDSEIVNTLFVFYLIQYGKEHYRRLQRGVRQKNLNLTMIKEIEIIHPPLERQNKFAEKIKLIEGQTRQAQANLEKSEALFNSLLHRAFTGELTQASKAA